MPSLCHNIWWPSHTSRVQHCFGTELAQNRGRRPYSAFGRCKGFVGRISNYSQRNLRLVRRGQGVDRVFQICDPPGHIRGSAFALYGLDQKHKHLPEMKVHGRLKQEPVFLPSYSNALYRAMLVHIEIRGIDGNAIHNTLVSHYTAQKYVKVEPLRTELKKGCVLSPEPQNETNNLQPLLLHQNCL